MKLQANMSIKNEIDEYLNQVSLGDIMSSNVLTVSEGWSIRRLSQFLIQHKISGAPVVNAKDVLLGVVTQSDIIRFESSEPSEQEVKKIIGQSCGTFGSAVEESEIRRIQDKANEYCTVNSIMTPSVLSVDINSSLTRVYRTMVKEDIHRMFVTEKGLLTGVISAMDILKKLIT